MPALNIIVATAEAARLYAALETAMASAALGHPARLFLQGEAVALMQHPIGFAGDAPRTAIGQPGLAELIEEAIAMEVGLYACQSGMALTGVTATELHLQVRAGGLVGFLADVSVEDRLLVY